MSELRDAIANHLAGRRYWNWPNAKAKILEDCLFDADKIIAIVERTCVERERAAFVEGWEYGRLYDKSDYKAEAVRSYPMPEEK